MVEDAHGRSVGAPEAGDVERAAEGVLRKVALVGVVHVAADVGGGDGEAGQGGALRVEGGLGARGQPVVELAGGLAGEDGGRVEGDARDRADAHGRGDAAGPGVRDGRQGFGDDARPAGGRLRRGGVGRGR
jgi:hypothetical protein